VESALTAIRTAYAYAALSVLACMTTWFVIALVLKRNDVVDTAWGLGFIMIGRGRPGRCSGVPAAAGLR